MKVTKLYKETVFDNKKSGGGYDLHAVVSEREQYHTDEKDKKYILLELGQTKRISSGIKIDEKVRHKVEDLSDAEFSTKEYRDIPYTEELWCLVTNNSEADMKIYSGDKIGKLVDSSSKTNKEDVSEKSEKVEKEEEGDKEWE